MATTQQLSFNPAWSVQGDATNLGAGVQVFKSSAATPTPELMIASFDGTVNNQLQWTDRMPADYSSGLVAKIQWMANAAANAVVWSVQIAAVTPNATERVDNKSFAVVNQVTDNVPGTAYALREASLTMTNADSVAAGDLIVVTIIRLPADVGDTLAGAALLAMLALEYQTP